MSDKDSYEAWLAAELGVAQLAPEDVATTRFEIRDDSAADWALRKLAAIERQQRERSAFVAAEIERLQTWQAREDEKAQRFADYLTACLRVYYDVLKAEGKVSDRRKSYDLPHGRLTARTVPAELERDDDALLAFAKPLGLVRVKEEPDWAAIKKRLVVPDTPFEQPILELIDEQTGEVLLSCPCPGVRVKQPAHEVFTPKPSIE